MCKRVSVYVSEWVGVFAVPIYFLFSLWFLVVFGNAYDFVFVTVCFFLLYALVFYVYCRVLPGVLLLSCCLTSTEAG